MRVSKDEGVSSAHWKSSFETGSVSPPQDEGELLKQVLSLSAAPAWNS